MRAVIRHLRAAALCCKGDGPSDGQLLESFVFRREETAFEALVRRHGPMVLGVCRRILRNLHDAEDAFQATFLVLSRKAPSVKPRDMVGNWLYGVAYRTAMKARAMSAKRRAKERRAGDISRLESAPDEELLEKLDHELSRLPDKYRVPVVLCELQGKSRKEASRLLGLPEGTLSWRLAQAKKMLAKRLSRHGAALSVGAVVAAMTETLSPTLRASTVKTVLSAGEVPAQVLALTEGVMKAMLLSKLKITVCAAALMLVAGVGATGLTYRATAQQPRQETAQANRPQADEFDALRLEIEALRKSLQATRERVKTLEGEVSVLKGRTGGTAGMKGSGKLPPGAEDNSSKQSGMMGMGGGMMGKGGGMMGGMHNQMLQQMQKQRQMMQGSMSGPGAKMMQRRPGQGMGGMMRREPSDPVSDAEAALKKLRANPGDEQATEELERALKKLKEREKPDVPSEGTPRKR